jgi:hypothetical protein
MSPNQLSINQETLLQLTSSNLAVQAQESHSKYQRCKEETIFFISCPLLRFLHPERIRASHIEFYRRVPLNSCLGALSPRPLFQKS